MSLRSTHHPLTSLTQNRAKGHWRDHLDVVLQSISLAHGCQEQRQYFVSSWCASSVCPRISRRALTKNAYFNFCFSRLKALQTRQVISAGCAHGKPGWEVTARQLLCTNWVLGFIPSTQTTQEHLMSFKFSSF